MRRNVVLCMLTFWDDDPEAAQPLRNTVVEAAQGFECAQRKADTEAKAQGLPAHNPPTLLGTLADLALNRVCVSTQEQATSTIGTDPA